MIIIITCISYTNKTMDGTADIITRILVAVVGETGVPREKPTIVAVMVLSLAGGNKLDHFLNLIPREACKLCFVASYF